MAELSPETQAIIQTLKDEGQLIRNRGTNSIRSVKIEMAKFHDVFNTISANVIEQTGILRQQAGFAAEALEAQRTKEQLEELQEKQKYEDTDSESKRKTDENIERIGNKLESAFSLKNLALAGAGLFVGYNLLKGFIDDQTAGGFSEMEKAIANTDWSGLGASNNSMIEAAVRFNEWLGNLPALLIGGGLVGTAARNFGAGLVTGGIGPRRAPAGAEDGPRGLGAIRTNVLMAITGLAWVYGESVKTWLTEQGVPEDVGAIGVDAVTAGISGATIAAMFGLGPAGILIGAIAGLAWVAGNGNSTEQIDYIYKDTQVSKGIIYYYKLKQIDFNGESETFDIVSAKIGGDRAISIGNLVPNPSKDNVKVQSEIISISNETLDVIIYNHVGVKVSQTKTSLVEGTNLVDISVDNLSSGTYFVNFEGSFGRETKKLVIVK
jgi:hypothetical protein